MKLTTAILLLGMTTGAAWAQNPDVIQDTRSTLQNLQKKQTIDQNKALAAAGQAPASGAAKPAVSQAATSSAHVTAAGKAPASQKPAGASTSPTAKPQVAQKKAAPKGKAKPSTIHASKPEPAHPAVAVEDKKTPPESKKVEKNYSAAGRRDPFVSPVVNRIANAGCSTGKRCLAIDQINLTGIVKAESGMIAVVVNSMNKAYFLRESDPVFNGYVVRITGDSIVFKETIQDKLGKPFEREVTKKIVTPAV